MEHSVERLFNPGQLALGVLPKTAASLFHEPSQPAGEVEDGQDVGEEIFVLRVKCGGDDGAGSELADPGDGGVVGGVEGGDVGGIDERAQVEQAGDGVAGGFEGGAQWCG